MRIAIIADIHEDVNSLKKALKIIEQNNCDKIVCLGDIVGYTYHSDEFQIERNADECVAIIKSICEYVVAGNHDLNAIKKLPGFKAGINYPHNWHNFDYIEKVKLYFGQVWLYDDELPSQLSNETKTYLDGLKEFEIFQDGDLRLFLSHFIFPDLSGSTIQYVKKKEDALAHLNFIRDNGCQIGLAGHGHIDGALLAYDNDLVTKEFQNISLDSKSLCIICPCITDGRHINGLVILDTLKKELEVISLTENIRNQYIDNILYSFK